MPRRTVIAIVALGLAGLVAAAGVGIVVNEVSGESIGLAADPLRAGEPLAPAVAERRGGERKRGDRAKGGPKNPKTTTTPTTTTIAPPTTTFEDLDDDSGFDDSDNSGPGSDNSGSDSDSSGHGSGSDDEPEFEDD